jgi:hypothetical protein
VTDTRQSLFNVDHHPPTSPLIIHFPPYPAKDDSLVEPPDFLQDWPVATINYRWCYLGEDGRDVPEYGAAAYCWPIPVHDISSAYAWLMDNLTPPEGARRDAYVYCSYIGASLGMSLSLTESHNAAFAVRGVVAYNGIYNWSMFLKDHHVNGEKWTAGKTGRNTAVWPPPASSRMRTIYDSLPYLFAIPENLFDPFASPTLFFQTSDLHVPPSFYVSALDIRLLETFNDRELHIKLNRYKATRAASLKFPPRGSGIRIPDTLLLYNGGHPKPGYTRARRKNKGNGFSVQARELEGRLWTSHARTLRDQQQMDGDEPDEEQIGSVISKKLACIPVGKQVESLSLEEDGASVAKKWLSGDRLVH